MTTDHADEAYIPTTLECAIAAVDKMETDISKLGGTWWVTWPDAKQLGGQAGFEGREGESLRSVLERWYLNED